MCERTIAEYEEELCPTKEEKERQHQKLQVVLHRTDVCEEHHPEQQLLISSMFNAACLVMPDGSAPLQQPVAATAVFAATVTLPEFWQNNPELWFQHVEAQFRHQGIKADETRYYHVVTALNAQTTRRVMGVLRDPPAADKYGALKTLLLRLYQLSDAERAERLLSLNGLGDRKPTELMDNMLALLGSRDASFLFVQLFLRQLPPPVRTALANSPLVTTKDYRGFS
nr:uncharacterized protein LOC133570496 [Nerophis lumbriciformis]